MLDNRFLEAKYFIEYRPPEVTEGMKERRWSFEGIGDGT